MSSELKNIIIDLRKRVDILTKELKVVRSFLSKMNEKRHNPYKWNRYYNRDNQEKNTKNQTKPHEKRVIEKNCQPDSKNVKFLQRKSQIHQKIHESSKLNQPEPMEVDKSSIHPIIGRSSNEAKSQFNRAVKREFSKNSQRTGQTYAKNQQVISILKNEKPKSNEHQSSNCDQPKTQSSRRHGTKFEEIKNLFEVKAKTTEQSLKKESKRNSDNTSKIFLQRKNDHLSFERHDRHTGKKLIGLIDLEVSNNFIVKDKVKHGCQLSLSKPIQVLTKFGKIDITHYVIVNLFTHNLKFFVIDDLGGFDLSLGFDGLRQLNAKIDLMSFELFYIDRNKIEDNFF